MAVVENRLEPLYERFREQHLIIFKGGSDPLETEAWMELVTSTPDYIRIEGNDRVACASNMLWENDRIWWGMIGQHRDVATMTWAEFQAVSNKKYYNIAIRAAKMTGFASLV